jgi:hypothetical protein
MHPNTNIQETGSLVSFNSAEEEAIFISHILRNRDLPPATPLLACQ